MEEIKALIKNMMCIGTVFAIDKSGLKARVVLPDKNQKTSGWLHVLTHPPPRHMIDGREVIHENWMPEIGDTVMCLFIVDGDGDGVVLGRI